MGNKFHVVSYHGSSGPEDRVFARLDMDKVKLEEATFVVFPGGADINPELYNEECLHHTNFSRDRDDYEVDEFSKVLEDQWTIGICRGAQLLCALSGGSLWQDVNNHAGAPHITYILNKELEGRWGKDTVIINSYHHQMIRELPSDFEVLVAANNSTKKVSAEVSVMKDGFDIEVAWSKDRKMILFQGHPEFGHPETEDFFGKVLQHCVDKAKGS